MNLHDILTELWRMTESGDVKKETRLESTANRFQDMLFDYNDSMGKNAMNEFIGPLELGKLPQGDIDETTGIRGLSQSQRDEWAPFTFAEIDAIRHYYGQKIALENEGTIMGLSVPFAHEVAEPESGLFSPNWEESLYDVYVNAVAAKDYYTGEGLPGTPFGQMLMDGNVTEREFTYWGLEALGRVPVYEGEDD